VSEVARDFLVNVRRMKQAGRAMEECDEGKRQAGVTVRGAAKLHSELPPDEFERWHVLFASEGDGPVFRDEAVIVRIGGEEIEGAAASFQRRARGSDGGEKIEARATAKQREDVPFVIRRLESSVRNYVSISIWCDHQGQPGARMGDFLRLPALE
jgi:hypothetical protein